ncbi:MAG TPA: hypothetical protein EYQ66_05935 [Myxococcales bacterium]|nr:hypothetical protein [Myxococcales bacterium]
MNRLTTALVLFLTLGAGLGAGYWAGLAQERPKELRLPPSRSLPTVPDDFVMPGLAGEVREVLLIPDLLERTAALATLLGQLEPESLEDLKEAYDTVFLDLDATELVLFGEWWASFDPRSAIAWTSYHWNTRRSIPVHQGIMREWGRSDPLSAILATQSAPNPAVRRRWVESILRGWEESVHEGALSYVESLGHGEDRQWGLSVVARLKVLRDGPEATIAWAESLPDDERAFKLNAFRRAAGAAAAVDPLAAAAFAERHLNGPYSKGMPRRVGMPWTDHDPEAAMRWLSTLPDTPNRTDGVLETYRRWLRHSRAAARLWINTVELEPWVDGALSVHAKSLGKEDPLEAIRVASQITDPELRQGTLGVVAREWVIRDEEAGKAWLDQSDLPEDFIVRILAISPGMRSSVK